MFSLEKIGKRPFYISVYSSERFYGGQEEGGWGYNVYKYIESKLVWETPNQLEEMQKVSKEFMQKYRNAEFEIAIFPEEKPGENTTTEKPVYC